MWPTGSSLAIAPPFVSAVVLNGVSGLLPPDCISCPCFLGVGQHNEKGWAAHDAHKARELGVYMGEEPGACVSCIAKEGAGLCM